MTKRNKILVSVLCACVAALLVAVCCLGFTFARYTTMETETASVGIATWDISLKNGSGQDVNGGTVTLSGIKPSADATGSESSPRKNDTLAYVGVLTNSGDVAATVTANAEVAETEGVTYQSEKDSDTRNTTYSSTVRDHITVTVYYATSALSSFTGDGTDKIADHTGELEVLTNYTLESEGTVYVYFDVLWTSDISGCEGTEADAFDTWMAECVASVNFDLTFNIVQAS